MRDPIADFLRLYVGEALRTTSGDIDGPDAGQIVRSLGVLQKELGREALAPVVSAAQAAICELLGGDRPELAKLGHSSLLLLECCYAREATVALFRSRGVAIDIDPHWRDRLEEKWGATFDRWIEERGRKRAERSAPTTNTSDSELSADEKADRLRERIERLEAEVEALAARPKGLEYRGVWHDGEKYEKGDTVTWHGSSFVAIEDTTEKPSDGAKSWRLLAKRGRDARERRGSVAISPAGDR